jgi:hypothetical protein
MRNFKKVEYLNEFDEIEKIIQYNLSNRGLDKVKLHGQTENCANFLSLSNTAVIVTGFPVKSAGVGETDGPPGALALAYALKKLNKKVIIVTDKYSEALIRAGAKSLRLIAEIYIFEEGREEEQSEEIIRKYKPEHIIAIERPGRNADNKCYSMYGEDITSYCPNTDILFIKAKENNIPTSAVGDGGNELGMGKIKEIVKKNVNMGNVICAQFETDNLVAAGVSNWGAFGICAGLSILNDTALMLNEDEYEELMREIVKAGAVDGCSKKREVSVDGITYEENLAVLNKLRELSERERGKSYA